MESVSFDEPTKLEDNDFVVDNPMKSNSSQDLISSQDLTDREPPLSPSILSQPITSPLPRPRTATFWVLLTLLLQAIVAVVHLQGGDFLPTFFPTTKDPTESFLLTRYTAYCLGSFLYFANLFIFIHDPIHSKAATVRLPRLSHLVSALLTIAARGSLSNVVDVTNANYSSFKYSYLLEAIFWTVTLYLLCVRRCSTIASTFTPEAIAAFVYGIVPKAIFGTLTSLLFLLGESLSCIIEKSNDAKPDNISQCDDVVESNFTLAFTFCTIAGCQLFVVPFLKSGYTMSHAIRFDFSFGEQAQIIFLSTALALSIFVFASSDDAGYATTDHRLSRSLLNTLTQLSLLLFMVAASISQGVLLSSKTSLSSSSSKVTEYIRGKMRTRSRVAFAPMIRFALATVALLAFLVPVVALVFASERVNSLTSYAMFICFTFAGFLTFARPTSKHLAADVFAIVLCSSCLGVVVVAQAHVAGVASYTKLGLTAGLLLIVLWLVGSFVMMKLTRSYIAMHSDSQVRAVQLVVRNAEPTHMCEQRGRWCSQKRSKIAEQQIAEFAAHGGQGNAAL